MTETLRKIKDHVDAVKGKPFEEKMRKAEMFDELFEYCKKLDDTFHIEGLNLVSVEYSGTIELMPK